MIKMDYLLISDLFFIFPELTPSLSKCVFFHKLDLCISRSYSIKRVILSSLYGSLFRRKDFSPGGCFFNLTLWSTTFNPLILTLLLFIRRDFAIVIIC
uniref:Uncharacterized protein n=1 Tax=Lepeophtheirus salmonis TaxID=72036 RepID=A0A0K2T2Z7_LEPSM